MSSLELKTYPDPCLRIRTKSVEQFTRNFKDILRLMADMMYVNEGIGLAATQVGLGLSVFIIDVGEGLMNFVNPVILEKSKEKSKLEEGCLSLPGVVVSIKRPKKIKVRAQNEKGEFFIKKFDGLTAKAIQHEIEHLYGKLIIDYLNPIRHFITTRKLIKVKHSGSGKACEVVCNVGRRRSRSA